MASAKELAIAPSRDGDDYEPFQKSGQKALKL